MIRVHALVEITCDAVTGRDEFGDIRCACRSTGRGSSLEAATELAKTRALVAGWRLTETQGIDTCAAHVLKAVAPCTCEEGEDPSELCRVHGELSERDGAR